MESTSAMVTVQILLQYCSNNLLDEKQYADSYEAQVISCTLSIYYRRYCLNGRSKSSSSR